MLYVRTNEKRDHQFEKKARRNIWKGFGVGKEEQIVIILISKSSFQNKRKDSCI